MNANELKLLGLGDLRNSPNGCSPEEIIKNDNKEIVAINCVCGKCHPFVSNTKSIKWKHELSEEVLSTMLKEKINFHAYLARFFYY